MKNKFSPEALDQTRDQCEQHQASQEVGDGHRFSLNSLSDEIINHTHFTDMYSDANRVGGGGTMSRTDCASLHTTDVNTLLFPCFDYRSVSCLLLNLAREGTPGAGFIKDLRN